MCTGQRLRGEHCIGTASRLSITCVEYSFHSVLRTSKPQHVKLLKPDNIAPGNAEGAVRIGPCRTAQHCYSAMAKRYKYECKYCLLQHSSPHSLVRQYSTENWIARVLQHQ
eukprot:3920456-Amphidinium_carterae.1